MNPYPYFDDSWNQVLVGLCVANVLAVLMPFLLPEGSLDLGQFTNVSSAAGPGSVVILFFFLACVLATIILWISMWMYWARSRRSLGWMFLLLLGAWGPAIAFYFMVYRKDLEAFKRHDEEERRSLTHF